MNTCPGNEPTPSHEMLRAFVMGELHGDGAAQMASHIEHCASCARRARTFLVLERCDQVLCSVKVAAAWQTVKPGLLELRQKLVISLKEQRDRFVRWADDLVLLTRTPALQFLSREESMRIVKEVPISPGDGSLTCSLRVFRDTQGAARIGVGFGDRTGLEHGVLRAALFRDDSIREAKPVSDIRDVAFDTQLSPGEYVVQLRGESTEYSVHITVD